VYQPLYGPKGLVIFDHPYPNWYYNLKAHPKIIAEVGAKTFTVLAREAR
jgi:F420H(2)-dependent quinone reductase